VAAVVVVAAVLLPLGVGDAGAAAGDQGRPARRVLVLSLPGVSWAHLREAHTPHLDALFEDSAVGNLAIRVVRRKIDPNTGYTTMGAGTRAEGPASTGLALARDEVFEQTPALEVFERRQGHSTRAGVLVLSAPEIHARQDALLFDAEAGAVGEALEEAGLHRAVIGNSDRTLDGTDPSDFDRPVAAMLMDAAGRVPGGRVDRGLLVRDPDAGFGLRLDDDAVLEAFEAEWRDGAVVAVEASDLSRTSAYRRFVRTPLRDGLSVSTLERVDRLAGRLLEHVDPGRDAVVVVSPASSAGRPRLMLAAVRAPTVETGLLYTATTRRPGFLTLQDLGAGLLDLVGVEAPASMEGRPFSSERRGDSASERIDYLVNENDEAMFRDDAYNVMSGTFVGLVVVSMGVAVLLLRRGHLVPYLSLVRTETAWRRAIRAMAFVGLMLLGVLPATYIAGALHFSGVGLAGYLPFVFGLGGVIALGAWIAGRRDPLRSIALVLGLMLVVIVGNVVAFDSELQVSTVFGDSPIIAGRFTGINNLTFAQLTVAGTLLAVLAADRVGGRRGAAAGIGLLTLLLLADGVPAWGADVGGVLTLVPAFGYVGYRLWGGRVRLRTVVVLGLATLVVVAAFGLWDLSRPVEDQSHLGRLFDQVSDEGFGALVTVVLRKAAANFRVVTSSVWALMVPFFFAFFAYVVYRRPRFVRAVEERVGRFDIALGGLLVAGVLGFALNDSGIAVPGMMLAVFSAVLVHLSLRFEQSAEWTPEAPWATRNGEQIPEPATLGSPTGP
jgi:hypothetical protein